MFVELIEEKKIDLTASEEKLSEKPIPQGSA
jgi:hypothetical protein